MGIFKHKKAAVLLGEAKRADLEAEKAFFNAQTARALAAQRRVAAARAEAEENASLYEKEAAEQDLRLAVSEQLKSKAVLGFADRNVARAEQHLAVCTDNFNKIVADLSKTPSPESPVDVAGADGGEGAKYA